MIFGISYSSVYISTYMCWCVYVLRNTDIHYRYKDMHAGNTLHPET